MNAKPEYRCGVYAIINLPNGAIYIGSAARSFRERWSLHISRLKHNTHKNWMLQKAWNLSGGRDLKFCILEECTKRKCIKREQWWIDALYPAMNILKVAGSALGAVMSDEARKKISIANKGRKRSAEYRLALSARMRGKKLSLQQVARTRATRRLNRKNLENNLLSVMAHNTWIRRFIISSVPNWTKKRTDKSLNIMKMFHNRFCFRNNT